MLESMDSFQGYGAEGLACSPERDRMDLNWVQEIDWKAKLEGTEHLINPEGPNYDDEEGYGYLEPVDKAVSMAKDAFGSENQVRESVVGTRDYLMDLGRIEHAAELDKTLISPGVGQGKLSCREVKGGNGRHPGDPEGKKQGPSGSWRERMYDDHGSFELSEPDGSLFDYIL